MRKEKQYHFIYKTTNLLSGKYYIGMHSTDSLNDGYFGSGIYLRRSLNKYGTKNHKLEILEFCKTREELKSREEEIVNLNEIAKKECMNLRVGGGGTDIGYWLGKKGHPHTEESKLKISKANSGVHNGMYGTTVSDDTRKKISENHSKYWSGKKRSESTIRKIRESKQNISDDTRRKMSVSAKGKVIPDEVRKKISETLRGIPQPKVKCPYCGKVGGNATMTRWHFNNCKQRGNKNEHTL